TRVPAADAPRPASRPSRRPRPSERPTPRSRSAGARTFPGGEAVNDRSVCLRTAEELVNGDRNVQYDEPDADFARTAKMWAVYKGVPFERHDVAVMLILMKVSRLSWSPSKEDHYFDIAG